MNTYILKDGTKVQAIPIGKAKIKIGDKSPDGMLTIVDRAPNRSQADRKARVVCLCKCGKYTVIPNTAFKNGDIKSCGCYNSEIHKELCKKIGQQTNSKDYTRVDNPYYLFLERTDQKDSMNSFLWKIKCKNCGKEYLGVPNQLISNTRRRGNNPCECWRFKSKGVLKIEQILKNNNIIFIKEYTFSDCLSDKGSMLRFDFYLPQLNILIEYDGEQHFIPTNFGSKTQSSEEYLKKQQKNDIIKNNYCIKNNLKLIRISYKDYNDLTLENLLK